MVTPTSSTQTQASAPTEGWSGTRDGHSQEITIVAPLKAGGADELRAVYAKGKAMSREERKKGSLEIGTVHDARSTMINNDTQFLFAAVFDGTWDAYIDDFAANPNVQPLFDELFFVCEGYPGMLAPGVKEWLKAHTVLAGDFISGYPDLTVKQIWKDQRINDAFQKVLDTLEFRAALDNPANAALVATPAFQALLNEAAG